MISLLLIPRKRIIWSSYIVFSCNFVVAVLLENLVVAKPGDQKKVGKLVGTWYFLVALECLFENSKANLLL